MEIKTIGIPKALLYHDYHTLWQDFFQNLGYQVVDSGDTNKRILDAGISAAVDEACLPVKVFYGHVMELSEKVDYLFLPRVVSVERREYMCPKLLGIPDMIRAALIRPPVLIDVNVNLRMKGSDISTSVRDIARILGANEKKALAAWKRAEIKQKEYEKYLSASHLPPEFASKTSGCPVAVLGHGYNIFDKFINMNLIGKLQSLGAEVHTKEMVPESIIDTFAATLPKKMFWTFGRRLMGSGLYYLNNPEISGIIFLASFGCGPDSLVGELLERRARREGNKPFLFLTIDEHSGEAGLLTRVEAFMDIVKREVS